MLEVLCLRPSPQEMGKYNHTVSQVDTLNPQDYWNISHVVTRLFTEAPDASPPTDATLRLLTTRLGWDVGEFWIVNELRMALECAAFYSPTADSFKNFETVSRARRFSFGEGLPGSTWKSRGVVCFPDLSKEENFPRLSVAALEHLHTGVAFPLYVGKKVLGVVEFFSLEYRVLASPTQDFLFALGGQMGVFLELALSWQEPGGRERSISIGCRSGFGGRFHYRRTKHHSFCEPVRRTALRLQPDRIDWEEADAGHA